MMSRAAPKSNNKREGKESLTRRQRRLRAEIEDIACMANMDHWNILDYEEERRTSQLGLMKDQLVRGQIIMTYTFVDELLSSIIVNKYFTGPDKQFTYKQLWRTKKFQAFCHHVLDGMYLLGKMRLVHDLRAIPKEHRDTIDRLNALRNALAHSFFPQQRYQYRQHKKVVYRDLDIFTVQGFTRFQEDRQSIVDYLLKRAFGI
jgi:hypothetical protein